MFFKQLFESESSTYTYLLACEHTKQAILIDPVASEIDVYMDLLEQHDLSLVYSLDTHVHADHVTGAKLLKERAGSKAVLHRNSGVRARG